jgi:hypothetical protein
MIVEMGEKAQIKLIDFVPNNWKVTMMPWVQSSNIGVD